MYSSAGHGLPFQANMQTNPSMPGLPMPNLMPQTQQMPVAMAAGANPMDIDMVDLASLPMVESDTQALSTLPIAPSQQSISSLPNLDNMGNITNVNAAGAGPMPAGFGMQNPSGNGSTLTEFTKRRNWSKLVLEELRDLMMVLSADGRVQHVSPSCRAITGYDNYMMLGKFMTDFIHQDDRSMFIREFNESIASANQMRFFYRLRISDESFKIFEAFGHPHLTSEAYAFGRGGAPYCRGYFMMSRPYPTRNTSLLDSFLEHKIENERLLKRIAELKKEEQDEEQEQESLFRGQDPGTMTPSDSMRMDSRDNSASGATNEAMPPPARPGAALTRANLSEALASARPDSIGDKMARYEGATHLETIEMLTGLRYRDGERSQGISTGAQSPALIRGDAGIAILADRDGRMSIDRKKKAKVADEYVCTDCGTLDSPEWRKGPSGPKTLCNACGLRWAKKEKKRQQVKSGPPTLSKNPSTTSS